MENKRAQDREPITTLVADLWRDSAQLIRGEAALAKAELSEKAGQVGVGIAWSAAGAVVILAGLVFLLFSAMTALAMVLPEDLAPWLAPLIIAAIALTAGAWLLGRARRALSPGQLTPTQFPRSVRKDVDTLKEHMP